jgi:hypothetical protein
MLHGLKRGGASLVAALALCAMTAPQTVVEDLEVSRLGLFSDQLTENNRIEELEPYAAIPYRVGTSCYGWVLYFEPVDGTVELDEILALPAPAAEWGGDATSTVAEDAQSARTHLRFDGESGVATHSWCVAEGDPEGQYVFTVFHRKKKLGQLPFRLKRV